MNYIFWDIQSLWSLYGTVTVCSAVSGPVVGQRPEHHNSPASPMISAAASAAGPPLVASPYPQSYLQYGQVIQAMSPHYHQQVTEAANRSFKGPVKKT